ncbi:hypothetical protein V6N13_136513 [Hibiscus sabdariffa]|uniref:Uncharacterized protein n=1 Tax=Hibiscus sabdariffa TaxID=183260 RepID=A0ABR2DNC4_9ROSI
MGFLGPHQHLAFIFGVLGIIVSFLVFLAPVQTFYKIYKKKTVEGYQSIPYMLALSIAMLLLYYGRLKTNANLILGTSSFGCVIEVIYLLSYIIYAPKRDKLPNVLGFLLGITQMIIYVKYKNANKGVDITENMQKVDMESSVGDLKPSFADHEQEIKEITIVVSEKPVEPVSERS